MVELNMPLQDRGTDSSEAREKSRGLHRTAEGLLVDVRLASIPCRTHSRTMRDQVM